jgi:hypothetical protein
MRQTKAEREAAENGAYYKWLRSLAHLDDDLGATARQLLKLIEAGSDVPYRVWRMVNKRPPKQRKKPTLNA